MKQLSYIKGAFAVICAVIFISVLLATGTFGLLIIVSLMIIGGIFLLSSIVGQLRKFFTKHPKKLYAKDFSLKFLAKVMGFFLISGTLLFLFVFYTIGHDEALAQELHHPVSFSSAEYLFRSLICSLDLFMLDVDSNIMDRLDTHAAIKAGISIQAVLSFACTIALLVGLVYSRLLAYIRLSYRTRVNNLHNHLYLFFGNNEPSILLIKDIVNRDPKAIAVIIDEANVKEDNSNEWEGIVGVIAHKHKIFKTAERIGALVAIASQQLDEVDEEITSETDFDAFGYLGLAKIKKLITKLLETEAPQLHVFFMGEDEELNIRNIIALAKDSLINNIAANEKIFHRIYCHARYNGPNRVIQDVALKRKLNIKIVDSSHIAVELLKMNPECHPAHVVKLSENNPATVDTPLKTMIIGFGEVGRDAFRFLYEFGTFLSSSSTDTEAIRKTFDCTIVDNKLSEIQGSFKASMPAVFSGQKQDDKNIRFESIDYNSDKFYTILNSVSDLNYVIISIGNNDEAISLAVRIFNCIRKKREDLSDLRIFVRCTDDKKVEGMQKIADHYNFGYGKRIENIPVIRIFGQPEKIYTYDLIVSNHMTDTAKIFYDKYRSLSGGGKSWEERHKSMTETETPDIDMLRKLRRSESQDMANAFHAGTKIFFLKKALGENADWYSFFLNYFQSDGSANIETASGKYIGLSERENRIILRLAMLEHLRWNAAHELLGYQFNEKENKCNERTMRHNCLCPWSRIDGDYKKYDFCVVDATIALARESLIENC